MNFSHDILNRIIHQSVNRYKNWQVEPLWISVDNNEDQVSRNEILPEVAQVGSHIYREASKQLILNNDILILTSQEIDIPINSTLCLESHDNLFTITKAEYSVITYHKYQVFSNYLKISLKDYGDFVPFQLEFLRIIPSI
jgi:hypothetical protein